MELYELVAKLIKVRAKILNIKEGEIRKELSDIYLKRDFYNEKNAIETMKFYQKKYNLTISIINDKLVLGLMDTADQENHIGLLNCTCLSNNCDGYDITLDSLRLVNKEYPCFNNTNKISLTNLEYYIKRIQLHIKEIELKIKQFNDNLKYNIKPNIKRLNTESNINHIKNELSMESEEDKNIDENFEIRRNTLNKLNKNKNNNEISLVQQISNSFKNNYKAAFNKNKIEKKIISYNQKYIMNDNKYESIKTSGNDIEQLNKKRNSSFLLKLRKSVKEKKYLLNLAQCKSNKFLKIQKEEMRSLIMAKNKRDENNNFVDISSIFQRKKRNNNQNNDYILDNIINGISRRGNHERILSSYLINNNNYIYKNNKEFNNDVLDVNQDKEDKDMQTEEVKNAFSAKRKNLVNIKIKNKNSLLITSNNSVNFKKKYLANDLINSRNIVNLDGQISLGDKYMIENIPSYKKYNKQLNMNKLVKFGKLSEMIININLKEDKNNVRNKIIKRGNSNQVINFHYHLKKDGIHILDPLLFDKFNERYINKRFKTIEK